MTVSQYEWTAVAERFGVDMEQVRPDHLISHLLGAIAAGVPANDARSLVDLCRNRGVGDPLIVAALVADKRRGAALAGQWHIVSDDDAVRATAQILGASWIGRENLVTLIEDGPAHRSTTAPLWVLQVARDGSHSASR